uniref:Olfactory receptor 52K2-like n=1 Tax=Sinocyclocheilus rhinocerous TaxID=307959 RepID=A0A673LDB3_9TELE
MDDRTFNFSHQEFYLIGFTDLQEYRRYLFIPFFVIFAFTLFANSVIMMVIVKESKLHAPMYILIGFTAALGFMQPIFLVPRMLISFLFGKNMIYKDECLIQMFCLHMAGCFQSTVLFVVVPVIRNVLLVVTTVSLAGKLSFCVTNIIDHCFCEHMVLVQLACGDITINNIVGLLTVFFIPTADFILINISYIVIFTSVFKSGKTNMKALNTCITHFIVMSVTLTFALIAFLSYRIRNNFSPSGRVFVSTMYLLFPSCFNPIIYGVRTKEIRQTFIKFIKNLKVLPL